MSLFYQTRTGYGQPWSERRLVNGTGLQGMQHLYEIHEKHPDHHILVTDENGVVDHGYFPSTGYKGYRQLPHAVEINGETYERI